VSPAGRAVLVALVGLLMLSLAACADQERMTAVRPAGRGGPSPTVVRTAQPATVVPSPDLSGDPYADMARELHSRGVDVWFEADLVKRWLQGPASFQEALDRLGALAEVPGVRGFKVADELGYQDGLGSQARALQFLEDVRSGLASRAPRAQILIDMVVPELGCLGWTKQGSAGCTREARDRYPAATVSAVSDYLSRGLVDRLDLSTSLLDEWTYQTWGLTLPLAQQEAWAHVTSLGWGRMTVLQARKALADVGGFHGSPQDAQQDLHTYVQIPVSAGAAGVDIWTWRQEYDGATVGLLDDRLDSNPLWTVLVRCKREHIHLFTHMTPSLLPSGKSAREREYDRVADAFDAIFVAAGTG
jgi:hypothetical protein